MPDPITDEIVAEATKGGVTLPGWFLKVVAGCSALLTAGGIPWATWVTYTLTTIQARDEGALVRAASDRITALERAKQEHDSQFAVIAATKFTAVEARALTVGIESRLDGFEAKFDALQRDFDRNFGKRPSGTE